MSNQKSGSVKFPFGRVGSPPALLHKSDIPLFPNCQQKNRIRPPPPETADRPWREETGVVVGRMRGKLALR